MSTGEGSQSPELVKSDDGRLQVLIALLQRNREEIALWQSRLIQAVVWNISAITALTVFGYSITEGAAGLSNAMQWLLSVGIIGLVASHLVVSVKANASIMMNGRDLVRFQRAIGLHTKGVYLLSESIYPEDSELEWLPQHFIWWLLGFSGGVGTMSISILWML